MVSAEVSSSHTEVQPPKGAGEEWVVVDQASRNGTFVNREPVTRSTLSHLDEIVIGPFRFVYVGIGFAFPPP